MTANADWFPCEQNISEWAVMADISGTESADSLVGTAGNDTVNGNGGEDTIDGGAGDDVVHGGPDLTRSTAALETTRLMRATAAGAHCMEMPATTSSMVARAMTC